jgi:hypothetical protein
MHQIKKTKNYVIFKKMSGNRDVSRTQIESLKNSIRQDNQLNLHPIIVNSEMQVIDGQTRLIAAEELKVDVYYIQSDTVTDHHFVIGNVNQKRLDIKDYIHFYAVNQKNPDYIKFINMIKISKLYPKNLIALTVGTFNKNILDKLKNGEFSFNEFNMDLEIYENYLRFFDYVQFRKIKPFHMFRSVEFLKAFRWLCMTTGFDFERFIEKLDWQWVELRPQRTIENWYKLLIKIYNWKSQGYKLSPEFTDEIF